MSMAIDESARLLGHLRWLEERADAADAAELLESACNHPDAAPAAALGQRLPTS